MTEVLEILILSDGRAGHDAQSLGLAEALARQRSVRMRQVQIELAPWARSLPASAAHLIGRAVPSWPKAALVKGASEIAETVPDLVISAGRRAALVGAGIRHRTTCKAVQILDPKLGNSAFDALILPSHDGGTAPDIVRTLGALNRITPDTILREAARWSDRLPGGGANRLAVLVGGPSKSADFTHRDADALLSTLTTLMRTHALIVTTSRRTPDTLTRRLLDDLGESASVWTPDDDNPYPGLLGHADAVLVTEDSVNMASEAATAGLPVHVLPVTSVSTKITAFHTQLAAHGASRRFGGKIERWTYPRLQEADRIAECLIERLSL